MKSLLPPSPAFAADDVDLKLVHPSLGALLAWRYAQLLTVLPRRATGAFGVVGLAAWSEIERVPKCLRAYAFNAAPAVDFCRGGGVGAAGAGAA